MKTWLFTKLKSLHHANLISLAASLFFITSSFFLIWQNINNFPLAVPLWFSNPWGVERLAEPVFLWLLPTASFAAVVINFFLSRYFQEREKVLFLLLLWTTPFVSGLFFYTLLRIIFVAT